MLIRMTFVISKIIHFYNLFDNLHNNNISLNNSIDRQFPIVNAFHLLIRKM